MYVNNGVKINALQWTGKNKDEMIRFFGDDPSKIDHQSANGIYMIFGDQLYLRMANGQLMVNIGEYVVQTPRLTYYPCSPQEFERDHKSLGETAQKMNNNDIPQIDPIARLKQFNEVHIESMETSPIVASVLDGKYVVFKQGQLHICFYPDQLVMLKKVVNQIVDDFFGLNEPEPVSTDPSPEESNNPSEFEWEMPEATKKKVTNKNK
jgi:nucleoside diphosphate kinase